MTIFFINDFLNFLINAWQIFKLKKYLNYFVDKNF